jgi:hypothetical protein
MGICIIRVGYRNGHPRPPYAMLREGMNVIKYTGKIKSLEKLAGVDNLEEIAIL